MCTNYLTEDSLTAAGGQAKGICGDGQSPEEAAAQQDPAEGAASLGWQGENISSACGAAV